MGGVDQLRVAGAAAAASGVVLALTVVGGHLLGSLLPAALVGVGQAACRPAFQALVADHVPAARRQAANAAMSASVRATVLLGPALTALASRVVPLVVVLLSVGALWVVTAALPPRGTPSTTRMTTPEGSPARRGRGLLALALRDLREGVAEARRHPWFVSGLGALLLVIALGYSATSVALPLVARGRFGGDGVLAAATTSYTSGALLGALVMARCHPRPEGWWALGGLAAYGLVPLALALSPSPLVVVAVYALAGVGIEVFNVPWFTATQREVPPERLARVSSLDFLVSYGLAPVGLALLAPAIGAWGTTPVLLGCATACLVGPALAALVPSSRTFSVQG